MTLQLKAQEHGQASQRSYPLEHDLVELRMRKRKSDHPCLKNVWSNYSAIAPR